MNCPRCGHELGYEVGLNVFHRPWVCGKCRYYYREWMAANNALERQEARERAHDAAARKSNDEALAQRLTGELLRMIGEKELQGYEVVL